MTDVMPRAKRIHKAAQVNPSGQVSALCYKTPRAINLRRESWTLLDDAVTCKRCRAILKTHAGAAND